MKTIISTLLACLIFSAVNAQIVKGSFGHFLIGYGNLSLANVESNLKGNISFGTAFSLPKSGINFGGGYYAVKNKLLIGGNTSAISIESDNWEAKGVKAQARAGFLNVGYVVANSNKLFAYVLGGAGGGITTMKVSNMNGNTSILLDNNNSILPGRTAKYSISNPGFEIAAGFKKLLFASTSKKGRTSGLLLGIDAGYYSIPFKESWNNKADDKTLTGFPKSSTGVFYVRATIGGGKFLLKK